MEQKKMVPFPVRRAEIPAGDTLNAEILGVDDGSYLHISFREVVPKKMYQELAKKMEARVQNGSFQETIKAGQDCIIGYPSRHGGLYCRATVLETIPETGNIRCEIVDELLEVDVHRSQIYPTNYDILSYPKFSLKCKLVGMDCLQNSPHVKELYAEFMKQEWKPESAYCRVKILDRENPVPTVQLSTSSGKDLTDLLQQIIPTMYQPRYPEVNVPLKAKIIYWEKEGLVWFRTWKDSYDWILGGITTMLSSYLHGQISLKVPESSQTSWKEKYLSGALEMFIYEKPTRRKAYRVHVLSRDMNGHDVLVHFVDFGHQERVRKAQLVPARLIDHNLCIIPPQCLPIKFIGGSCRDFYGLEINSRAFPKYVGRQPVSIVLLGSGSLQSGPGPNVTGNRNQLPFGSMLSAEMPDMFVGQQLCTLPLAANCGAQQEEIQLCVSPPEADILVKAPHPNPSTLMLSLYALYHTRENCWTHRRVLDCRVAPIQLYPLYPAPVNIWSPVPIFDSTRNENGNYNVENGFQAPTKQDDNEGANHPVAVTFPSFPEQYFDNWIDWAMTVFEGNDKTTAKSISHSHELSPQTGEATSKSFNELDISIEDEFKELQKEIDNWSLPSKDFDR